MARSYRKPFHTFVNPDPDDKIIASRSWRRLMNQSLRSTPLEDMEDYVIPARYEASHNDRWGWRVDGNNVYCSFPEAMDYFRMSQGDEEFWNMSKEWYELIQRK